MEILLLIFILIYLFTTNKSRSSKLKELQTSIFQLDDKLRHLQQETVSLKDLLKKSEKKKEVIVKKVATPVEEIKPIIVAKKPEFVIS